MTDNSVYGVLLQAHWGSYDVAWLFSSTTVLQYRGRTNYTHGGREGQEDVITVPLRSR